jgi:hypothetical protein
LNAQQFPQTIGVNMPINSHNAIATMQFRRVDIAPGLDCDIYDRCTLRIKRLKTIHNRTELEFEIRGRAALRREAGVLFLGEHFDTPEFGDYDLKALLLGRPIQEKRMGANL